MKDLPWNALVASVDTVMKRSTEICSIKDLRESTDLQPSQPQRTEINNIEDYEKFFPDDMWNQDWERINKESLVNLSNQIVQKQNESKHLEEKLIEKLANSNSEAERQRLKDSELKRRQEAKDMISELMAELNKKLNAAIITDRYAVV